MLSLTWSTGGTLARYVILGVGALGILGPDSFYFDVQSLHG